MIHGLHKYRFCGEHTINRTKRGPCVCRFNWWSNASRLGVGEIRLKILGGKGGESNEKALHPLIAPFLNQHHRFEEMGNVGHRVCARINALHCGSCTLISINNRETIRCSEINGNQNFHWFSRLIGESDRIPEIRFINSQHVLSI